MAIPMIPLILLGVGFLALRGRKHPAKKTQNKGDDEPFLGPIQTVVFIPPNGEAPEGPSGEPGQPCDASDGKGAWDELGHCKTFWIDGTTDEVIATMAREEWEARGKPGFSDLCLAVPDPLAGELGAPSKDNPRFVEIVSTCLQRYYDVGALFPPTDAHGFEDPTSPYWVHEVWAKATTVVRKELCGL